MAPPPAVLPPPPQNPPPPPPPPPDQPFPPPPPDQPPKPPPPIIHPPQRLERRRRVKLPSRTKRRTRKTNKLWVRNESPPAGDGATVCRFPSYPPLAAAFVAATPTLSLPSKSLRLQSAPQPS